MLQKKLCDIQEAKSSHIPPKSRRPKLVNWTHQKNFLRIFFLKDIKNEMKRYCRLGENICNLQIR
jgi:hypothetical protein